MHARERGERLGRLRRRHPDARAASSAAAASKVVGAVTCSEAPPLAVVHDHASRAGRPDRWISSTASLPGRAVRDRRDPRSSHGRPAPVVAARHHPRGLPRKWRTRPRFPARPPGIEVEWSASTLVITPTSGWNSRNEPSLSSASTTNRSPPPCLAPEPLSFRSPPITKLGSRPARSRISRCIDVVVVLPWVPATAIPKLRGEGRQDLGPGQDRHAGAAPRGARVSFQDRPRPTTASGSPTCSGLWPTKTVAPRPGARPAHGPSGPSRRPRSLARSTCERANASQRPRYRSCGPNGSPRDPGPRASGCCPAVARTRRIPSTASLPRPLPDRRPLTRPRPPPPRLASASAASGRAKADARSPIPRRRGRSSSSRDHLRPGARPSSVVLEHHRAPPRAEGRARLPPDAGPSRTDTAPGSTAGRTR